MQKLSNHCVFNDLANIFTSDAQYKDGLLMLEHIIKNIS